MKTYKVKNYKGNLVESLARFQKKYPGVKIVEAVEEKDVLKINGEEKEQVKEAVGNKVYALVYDDSEASFPIAICSSIDEAKKIAELYRKENDDGEYDKTPFEIFEYVLNMFAPYNRRYKSVAKI